MITIAPNDDNMFLYVSNLSLLVIDYLGTCYLKSYNKYPYKSKSLNLRFSIQIKIKILKNPVSVFVYMSDKPQLSPTDSKKP